MQRTYLLGLIGEGITTSLTPPMHEAEAKAQGLSLVYRTIDLRELGRSPYDVGELLRSGIEFGFDAFNITHPCKQLVISHLDELSPEAERIGAVNTVLIRDGRLIGHNTDAGGFALGFQSALGDVDLSNVLQLGAGGAGAAVADGLAGLGASTLTIADPDRGRAVELCERLGRRGDVRAVPADTADAEQLLASASGLVNASPIGMHHHPGTPVSPAALRGGQWVADVVYRPTVTELITAARVLGCATMPGGHMAVGQAAATFAMVTGNAPDKDRMNRHFAQLVVAEEGAHAGVREEARA